MGPLARERGRWPLLLAAGCALVMLDLPSGDAGSIVGIECRAPVLLDGALQCDGEPLARSCGDAPVHVGDVLVRQGDCVVVSGRMAPDDLQALGAPIDINGAPAADLTSLPGVGPATATRIVAGRPYAAVEGLLEVRGIGPTRLAAMRDRVALAPVVRSP